MKDILDGDNALRSRPARPDAPSGLRRRIVMGQRPGWIPLAAAVLASLFAASALADREVFDTSNATYRSECGSCHIAYPPQLLPRESWQALMAGLPTHFGSDASVDAKTAKQVESYLVANASRKGSASTGAKPPLRITETRWFQHEHDEVPGRVWKSTAVKSPSNCGACHPGAERGDFSEHAVRVPN